MREVESHFIQPDSDTEFQEQESLREDWMIISDLLHNSCDTQDQQISSQYLNFLQGEYTVEEIQALPTWLETAKYETVNIEHVFDLNTESFNNQQKHAFHIITTHSKTKRFATFANDHHR